MAEKTKDTLFIDMKYIILYRKLGYCEIADDTFSYSYFDTTIVIESEEQRYEYCGTYYTLKEYKDFVMLECIDRLLKKGYKSSNICINKSGFDLRIINENGEVYCNILAAAWGKDYAKLLADFQDNRGATICLYTSQLSGGLVDYKSKIFKGNKEFSLGIFEKTADLYNTNFYNYNQEKDYPSEFVVEKAELLKYIGKEEVVLIPTGITRIGAGAFWNNLKLKEVIIPDGVKCICGDAFVYCENLKKVNIPSSVEEIGDDPFAGCVDIQIHNESDFFVLDNGVLFDKTKRTLIHYTSSKQDTEYAIPESVEWIGKHSFYKCENLLCVSITKNVKFMGNNAFSDCKKIRLINESSYFHYINGALYDKSKTTCMHYSMGSGVKEVKLIDAVRTIGRNCFWNCDMIEKLVIPASVRQIGYNPFANCKNIVIENHSPFYKVIDGILYDSTVKELVFCPPSAAFGKTVVLPDSVINIGRNSFTGCVGLSDIVLPSSLKYISRGAFSGCSNLTKITIPNSVEDLADWCFNNCMSLKIAYIPKRLEIKPNTFVGCDTEIIRV